LTNEVAASATQKKIPFNLVAQRWEAAIDVDAWGFVRIIGFWLSLSTHSVNS
jgi:hypothetical protein